MTARSALLSGLALALAASPASASPVVTGTLIDAAGAPAPGNVAVYAWPTGRGTRAIKLVGTQRVDASGRFAVDVSNPAAAATALAPRDDWADFYVVGETAGSTGTTVTSTRMRRGPGGTTAAVAATAVRPAEDVVLTADTPRPRARAAQSCPPSVSTRLAGVKSHGVIGEINNAYRDSSASFAYGERADTTVSVAFKPSGAPGNGGWSLDGSVHRGTERNVEISVTRNGVYSRKITSEFIVGRYRITSPCNPHENGERLKLDRWAGGWDDGRRQSGTLWVCRPNATSTQGYAGYGYFRRDDGEATTWSGGLEAFGVGLNTRSGFSRWVRLRFEFPRRPAGKKRYLCGSDGADVNHAKRIFSGAA
jgi:hypothetical protein